MTGNDHIAEIMHDHGIRPTAVRILVWRTLLTFDYAFAMSDLEGLLPTVDRSTLFRALTLFTEKDMLHTLDDGTGQQKYCICCSNGEPCGSDDGHHHHEQCEHVHITCMKCGHTYCLKDEQIPQVKVPEGFQIMHVQYVIQGICAKCAHWHAKD